MELLKLLAPPSNLFPPMFNAWQAHGGQLAVFNGPVPACDVPASEPAGECCSTHPAATAAPTAPPADSPPPADFHPAHHPAPPERCWLLSPAGGRLVVFESQLEHEVLPCFSERCGSVETPFSWSTRCCPASVKGVEVWIHLSSSTDKASAHMTYWQAWAGHSHYCRQGSHLPHLEYHAPLPALSDTPSPPGSTRRASQQYDRQYNRQSLSLWVRAPRTAPPSSRCHRHCPPPRPFLLLLLQGTSMMSRPILRLAVARPRLLPFKLPLRGISPWLPPRLLAALRHRPARSSCRLPLTVTRRPDGQCGTYSKRFGLVWEYIPQSVHGGFLGYMPPSHASYPHLYYTPLNVCMTTGKTTGAYPRRHRMAGVDKDLAVAIYV